MKTDEFRDLFGEIPNINTTQMTNKRKRLYPESCNGFTFLEIIVSISVIAIVFIGVFRMHSQSILMNNDVKFYTTAPLLAQSKIAELEIKSPEELSDGAGDFGEEFPGFRWRVFVDDIESQALGNISDELKKIDVTISFNNDEFIYTLRTYRIIQQG